MTPPHERTARSDRSSRGAPGVRASARASGAPLVHRRVVLKVGTNLLTAGGDRIEGAALGGVATQVVALRDAGAQVILVSSGAIAAGRQRLDEHATSADVRSRQALAAVGQARLMAEWDRLFELEGVVVAQALLTRTDLADRQGYLNARTTLLTLLDRGVLPVVNENDVVSVDEIEDSVLGDNDSLSAQVANLVDADLLLILTDIDGLYTADPARHPEATLIERVDVIDDGVREAARGTPGRLGRGGMVTKVEAAEVATAYGADVVIADGRRADAALLAARGEPVGTHFLPRGSRLDGRRRYLLSGLQVRGAIRVDEGAAKALGEAGTSLLPAGVVGVEGEFARGDVVRIETESGRRVATGIANYAAAEVGRIRGLRSHRIAEVLGHEYGEEVVHRNNLVLR
jgi:glutamate 5-kinase